VTILPAIGHGAARALRTTARFYPGIRCDACGRVVSATVNSAWLRSGLPRGWERHAGASGIVHYCAQCKAARALVDVARRAAESEE
jgi:hypothetical protein